MKKIFRLKNKYKTGMNSNQGCHRPGWIIQGRNLGGAVGRGNEGSEMLKLRTFSDPDTDTDPDAEKGRTG